MPEFIIRPARTADIEAIYSIMNRTRAAMEDPDLYVADTLPFIRRHIEEKGFILLASDGRIPAGFLLVRFPGEEPDNLGYDLSFSKQERELVAHMESAAVLPEYQGNRLQRKLVSFAETLLAERGYQYAMATVSPKNFYSLHNMLACGYRIAKTKLKYGGKERHILIKTIMRTA